MARSRKVVCLLSLCGRILGSRWVSPPGPRQELVPSSVLPVANPHHQRSTPSPPTHPSIPRVNQYVRRAPIDIPPPHHPADCSGRNLTSRNLNDNLERQFVHPLKNGERSSAHGKPKSVQLGRVSAEKLKMCVL